MNIFKHYFKDTTFDGKEVSVRCPFDHYDEQGNAYQEANPSAHINTDKSTFHCKVCGEGYSETKFLAKMNGSSYHQAKKLISELENNPATNWETNVKLLWEIDDKISNLKAMGITENVIHELQLGFQGFGVAFPVFMYGELMDIRTYNLDKEPDIAKWKSQQGAKSGLIIPFDIWIDNKEDTLIMAGEKDMALARSLGYNAINITGGEQAFPKLFKHSFKNRNVYVVYDNDDAGKTGARKVAAQLKEAGAIAYVVEGHHEVAVNKGEDFSDYIVKYGKTRADFDRVLAATAEFTEVEYQEEKEKILPTVKILEATKGKHRNKLVRSTIQVTATFKESFGISDYVEFEKKKDDDGVMNKGEKREWSLDENNIEQILLLMDSRLRETDVRKNMYGFVGIQGEKNVTMRKLSHSTVFKASIIDLVESAVVSTKEDGDKEEYKPLEITAYIVDKKLEQGKKYKLTYKLVQHPLQAQEMVAIVTNVEESDDTVATFKLTDSVKDSLKVFQGEPITKMQEIFERAKGLIGSFANEKIFFATDLTYHSPLDFKFGQHILKAVLDVMIVGESRTGKSATATALLKAYELGTFSTLKNATTAGMIGGSDKVGGSFRTNIGTIPRNHKGMVIFEEFSGADPKFIKDMTDIRSSGKVNLTRVNGELKADAKLRMLTLSNQRTVNGHSRKLSNYPNGVSVLVDLVGAAEDIARYDFFVLVPEPPKGQKINPLAKVSDPFNSESYKNRVRWVWSRKQDQIKFDTDVDQYIVDQSYDLADEFSSHIQFLGNEAYVKLAKVAVAVAGMLVSTDDSWENIIVKKSHVDWAVNFLRGLYDNETFRLKQYVASERRYATVDDQVVARVQELYQNHATLLEQMEENPDLSNRNLQAISGLEGKDFSKTMNEMAKLMLFQWHGDKVVPSERFRTSMGLINRNVRVKGIGE
jgi:DNA primase